MRDNQRRAACRANASAETHGLAQEMLQRSIRSLATGSHSIPSGQMAAIVQENAEIASDFDPRGGVR